MTAPKIFFYPHPNLRDRQLDTIRLWPRADVINPEIAEQKPYHYSADIILRQRLPRSWHNYIPAINIKLRPKAAPKDALVYCWGGIISHGDFILELDNPYCLTGYNVGAFRLYKNILRQILLSPRCRQIRCISRACHDTLRIELGAEVGMKAKIFYPLLTDLDTAHVPQPLGAPPRILFISTRFKSKGGPSILRISERLLKAGFQYQLTLITYLPEEYTKAVAAMPHITCIPANRNRAELIELYKTHDIFFFPTYSDSFGMVLFEAIAHGMAAVANDIYAVREMILPGHNGALITSPISNWCGPMPTKYFKAIERIRVDIDRIDLTDYEDRHFNAISALLSDPQKLFAYKQFSQKHFKVLTDQPDYFSMPDGR